MSVGMFSPEYSGGFHHLRDFDITREADPSAGALLQALLTTACCPTIFPGPVLTTTSSSLSHHSHNSIGWGPHIRKLGPRKEAGGPPKEAGGPHKEAVARSTTHRLTNAENHAGGAHLTLKSSSNQTRVF